MADLSKATPECSCLEAWGEDPACELHGFDARDTALRNILSLFSDFPDKRPSDGEVMEVIDAVREVLGDG